LLGRTKISTLIGMSEKYKVPDNENEILPNKLGLSSKNLIEKDEAKGFAKVGLLLGSALTNETVFDISLINNLHKVAFARFIQILSIKRGT
jgi:cell filamentation protein